MGPIRARRTAEDRGAAMVEFALVLPLLVMLVFGIISFGRAYNTTISMRSAAREGARAAALGDSAVEVESVTRAAAPSADIDSVTLTQACAEGEDGQAVVMLTTSFEFMIPFVPVPEQTLTAEGVMRCET
jgi:Flp pilus assembly protein TadG